ncbi:hypothetical protein GCK72_023821 [Caenorhabditis remanei]|uniref:Rad60/SUMO-like domain-containing protein n=2 Tax=Caenorhabditis TaxID=6237 RepID=E3M275_CAERE|nr:hypothetical protein GCK72_023821 [Caenorhabditis remanei]EFO89903.1 hypothetical protein CRE_07326 [Caenorhabditis remanei]KAF1747359.1 hypothetical protein GCK72_023821 [Caenorhabditis remanei]
MRVPVIYNKPGACFPIVDNHIRLYAYETDHTGKVVRASIHSIHYNAPLIKLREKYAAKYNIFPHEIDMFYDDKEVFDDDTCRAIGIQHEQIVRMQVTFDTIYTKDRDDNDF